MDTELLSQLFWAVCPSIIVGIVMAFWNSRQNKANADRKKQEDMRYKSEILRIDLLVATAQLSYATAVALKRGYANGEVEEGVKAYNAALTKFREFERSLVVDDD